MRSRLAVLALGVGLACTSPHEPRILDSGTWGGEHLLLTIHDSTTAELEFDCADGAIDTPLRVEASGRFSWHGTYTPGHGGPIRTDEHPDIRPATYTGVIAGSRMRIEMRTDDGAFGPASFDVIRGRDARVFKCL